MASLIMMKVVLQGPLLKHALVGARALGSVHRRHLHVAVVVQGLGRWAPVLLRQLLRGSPAGVQRAQLQVGTWDGPRTRNLRQAQGPPRLQVDGFQVQYESCLLLVLDTELRKETQRRMADMAMTRRAERMAWIRRPGTPWQLPQHRLNAPQDVVSGAGEGLVCAARYCVAQWFGASGVWIDAWVQPTQG